MEETYLEKVQEERIEVLFSRAILKNPRRWLVNMIIEPILGVLDQDGNTVTTASAKELQETAGPILLDGVRFRSIGTAVGEAESYSEGTEPADTIEVAPGTYVLNGDMGIDIDKDGLTLKAVGATEDTIIDFSSCDLGIRIINVDNMAVEGFTMRLPGLWTTTREGRRPSQTRGTEYEKYQLKKA